MENGTASTGGGGDRRRTTVSGPLPQVKDAQDFTDDEDHIRSSEEAMRLPWGSPSAPTSPTKSAAPSSQPQSAGHKRSLSNNILARLNFLKNTAEDGMPSSRDANRSPQSPESQKSAKSRKSIDDDKDTVVTPVSPFQGESAMVAALQPVKTRKRKGSLRKTALLGGRKLVTEGRERKNSLLQRNLPSKQTVQAHRPPSDTTAVDSHGESLDRPTGTIGSTSALSLRKQLGYENIEANDSRDNNWSERSAGTTPQLSLLTGHAVQQGQSNEYNDLANPLNLRSPASQASYMSTTDDDDVLTFDSRTTSSSQQREMVHKKPLSTAKSYFPSIASASQESLSRRLSAKQSRSSPLAHSITSPSSYTEPEPHDYTETEYWGWVILLVTWLTFTVGMGSCLEIWSWAWDVGETPYAPPELEDDDTLPIVGYYPALIVLTGVVAWVWITVAWLGMKYFRHAKIEV